MSRVVRLLRRKTPDLFNDERGQSSVLIAMTAVVFIAFLAFVANIGQVIHEKMLTQAIADAAVLSAANVQTVGLNEIADLNAEIEKLATECNDDFERANNEFVATQGWATYFYYKTQIDYLYELQDEANEDFATMASDAAQRVVALHNENYKNLHPKDGGVHRGFSPEARWSLEEVMGESYPQERMADLQVAKITRYSWTEYYCASQYCTPKTLGSFTNRRDGVVTITFSQSGSYPAFAMLWEHRYLSPSTKVYYRARVKREASRALIDMDHYGFAVNIPEIIAYSQAQPNKGNIEEFKPDYEARLAPLWQTYPNETGDSEYWSLLHEFKH